MSPTAAAVYYILAGQHKFKASQAIREGAALANRDPPQFTVNFRCTVLKEGLTVDQLQRAAGRLQSRSQAVMGMSYADTMELLLTEGRALRDADPLKEWPNRTRLLSSVYQKSGKSDMVDGAEVSTPSPQPTRRLARVNAVRSGVPPALPLN